ncbi:Rgg/GadR/MutR family transcriptional regulator [uncultured Lactobacillus sp.]|uniref:Rgg/GadR/MutR family transcriptional regulator n=1 Tax=uncultured Lactobacillus sp. TaxID=153152 RepID=UPI002613D073|nr:Rgg/GadR/MutR family transcriptional regulator [uncultured Lactobacillus sp.]
MYGHEFKKLRKAQGISQKPVCQGICSESKLSRWENDLIEVEFSTAMKLLDRIHITSHEFMGWSKFAPDPEIDEEIQDALNSDNIPLLRRVAKKQIAKYHQTHDKRDLFIAAPLCSQLIILDHKKYLSDVDLNTLAKEFSKVTVWSEYYISLFGSCLFILNSKQIYGISMQILKDIDHIRQANTSFDVQVVMGSLEDAVTKLISQNDLEHAQKLITALSKVELPIYMMFFKLTLTFLKELINYVKTDDEQPILSLIDTLLNLNCSTQAATYLDMLKYIQHCKQE